jgi:hypothetical protein
MATRNFAVAAVLVAVVGCGQPEAFHSRLAVTTTGAAGTGLPGTAGTGAPPTGAAGDQGAAGAGLAGSGGDAAGASGLAGTGGGLAGTGGPAGTSGGAGGAGTGGGAAGAGAAGVTGAAGTRVDAGAMDAGAGAAGTRDAGRDTGGGAAGAAGQDAGVEAPPAQPYKSTAWKPTASITAAGTADLPPNAFDGMLSTRWSTGRAQAGNESFLIDLGSAMPVSRVVLDDTTHPTDFPAAYALEVSTNNAAYTAVKAGAGMAVTDIRFTQVTARYVRIRQTGTTPTSWWSIDEIRIYP